MEKLVNLDFVNYIKRTTPNLYSAFRNLYWYSRKQILVTKLCGPKWQRSRDRVEVYITYDCNLKCINCDISCRQAPTTEHMKVSQIREFLKESVDHSILWEKIRVMGGEPTLHPNIYEILNLLIQYKKDYSSGTRIQLITNGFGKYVKTILQKVPRDVEIENSDKKTSAQLFTPFNTAPKDSLLYKFADFSNGCPVTSDCGIGLTPYGYYCCGIAGGIDRIFGFDMGRKRMPESHDSMADQLHVFCSLCGHFLNREPVQNEIISHSWLKAYLEYKKSKPDLCTYS